MTFINSDFIFFYGTGVSRRSYPSSDSQSARKGDPSDALQVSPRTGAVHRKGKGLINHMKTVSISLNSIDKVKSFVNDLTKFDDDFDLVSGRYVIDAKSIMGIFSLDLSRPINLNIHATENLDKILEVLDPYIIK